MKQELTSSQGRQDDLCADGAQPVLTADTMTKDERSILVYAESCIVDKGSLLEGQRMNEADLEALARFQSGGLLTWGRIPAALLGVHSLSSQPTHWVRFSPEAWVLASQLRQLRAVQLGPYSKSVFAEVDERAADRAAAASAADGAARGVQLGNSGTNQKGTGQ